MELEDLDMSKDVPLEEMSQDEIRLWIKTLKADKEKLEIFIKDAESNLADINNDLMELERALQ